jgi:beta-galactosidase
MRYAILCILSVCAALTASAAPRQVTPLNAGWKFRQGEVFEGEQPDLSAQRWKTVSLPHCWGWEEAQRGERYLREAGWYRRQLVVESPRADRRYYVRFGAAGSVAKVYLNGVLLGEHRGAFGAFCYDLTRYLSPTGTNQLAVRVSNEPEPDIAPISGDFCVFGGLYRTAELIETDAVSFALTDHASPGVAWLQTRVTTNEAVLDVTAQLCNPGNRKEPLTLVARLVDGQGTVVASAERKLELAPRALAPAAVQVTLANPHLWNGRKDPYLYQAVVELRDGETVRDSVGQSVGLRFYSVDPNLGFFLNGKSYHLHGVNRHQDRQDKGWAISEEDMRQDVELIKEMGCTVVRCAHYQHSDLFYSLCDQAGILVWAEIPQVDQVMEIPAFADTSRSQLLDLIRQNVNHASIFTWSLYNEIRPGHPDPHRLLQDLGAVVHGEDPSRPTIAATCTDELPQMNQITDLLGWNIYPGWYDEWGPITDFPRQLEKYRTTSRHGGYCISEYGAGANIEQHEQNPKAPKPNGQWHPEEWQGILHEEAWAQMKVRPYVWGTFLWNLCDFTSYWRKEGGVKGRNDKGLITYDRKTKKDAFYFYKANWSEEPVLYITSRRHIERTNAATDVKVYSNATEAELLLNGASQGVRANNGNGVILWQGLTLQPGANKVEARAKRNGQDLSDTCAWTLKPSQ